MNRPSAVERLFTLFETKGDERYRDEVTHLEHALQCASLARRDGATNELVVAALFHDVGHLLAPTHEGRESSSNAHEMLGARMLASLFGTTVGRPVALHVTANRWHCTIDPVYLGQLTVTSRAIFESQGGLLSAPECRRFELNPGFESALALRSWDDEETIPGLAVSELRDYEGTVHQLARRLAGAQ